jgi:hypothetical protein
LVYHITVTSLKGRGFFHHLPPRIRFEVHSGPELFLVRLMLEVVKQSWVTELQGYIGKHCLELLQPVQVLHVPILLDKLNTICHLLEQG